MVNGSIDGRNQLRVSLHFCENSRQRLRKGAFVLKVSVLMPLLRVYCQSRSVGFRSRVFG